MQAFGGSHGAPPRAPPAQRLSLCCYTMRGERGSKQSLNLAHYTVVQAHQTDAPPISEESFRGNRNIYIILLI